MKIKQRKTIGTGIVVLLVAAVFFMAGIVPSAVGAPPWSDERDDRGGMFRQRHHRPTMGFWQNQRVIEQLGLTQEQVQQLRDADYAAREKHLTLRTELDHLRLQMDKALSHRKAGNKAVRQLAEKAADVQGKLFVLKIEERLELETILTTDQIQQLNFDTRYHRRGGPGNGMRPYGNRGGYGNGDCPRFK